MNTARINLNSLSLDEKKNLTKKIYTENSYFHKLFQQDQIERDCHHLSHALREQIERILLEKNLISQKKPLENLHEQLSPEMKAYNFDDGVNKISTFFYETDQTFLNVYYQFIQFLREHFVNEAFWFQATPTIRIHCPESLHSDHYPRYHSDISYGHPPEEINIWLPLTDALDGHSFRLMSIANSKTTLEKFDYDFGALIHSAIHDKSFSNFCDALSSPVCTAFGNMLAFDSRALHTGEPMKTHTRVSLDIRILPLSQYKNMDIEYQGSGRRKILFAPGHCYHQHDSDYFLSTQGIYS